MCLRSPTSISSASQAGLRRRCHAPSLTDVLTVGFWRGLASSLLRSVVHTRGPRRLPSKRVAWAAEGNALVTSPVMAAQFPWDGGRVEVRRLVLACRLERDCGEVRVAGNVGRTSRAACVGAPKCPLGAGGWFELLSAYLFGQGADVCTLPSGRVPLVLPETQFGLLVAGGMAYSTHTGRARAGVIYPLNFLTNFRGRWRFGDDDSGAGSSHASPAVLACGAIVPLIFISMGHAWAVGSRCLAFACGYRYRSLGLLSLPRS